MSLEAPAAETPPDGLSRRRLMRQAAAVGAAGLAATLVTGTATTPAAAGTAPAVPPAGAPLPDHDGPVIVHVRDLRSGHLDLYSGDRHQRIQDPQLAAALARALA